MLCRSSGLLRRTQPVTFMHAVMGLVLGKDKGGRPRAMTAPAVALRDSKSGKAGSTPHPRTVSLPATPGYSPTKGESPGSGKRFRFNFRRSSRGSSSITPQRYIITEGHPSSAMPGPLDLKLALCQEGSDTPAAEPTAHGDDLLQEETDGFDEGRREAWGGPVVLRPRAMSTSAIPDHRLSKRSGGVRHHSA